MKKRLLACVLAIAMMSPMQNVKAEEGASQAESSVQVAKEDAAKTENNTGELVWDTPIYAQALQDGYLYSTSIYSEEPEVLSGETSWREPLKQRLVEGTRAFQRIISIEDLGIPWIDENIGEMQGILQEVVDENPDLFYISYISNMLGSGTIMTMIDIVYDSGFTDSEGNVDISRVNTYNDAVAKAVACVKSEMSDVEKLLAVYDYLVLHCAYDYENYLNNTIPYISYSAYGALVEGKAVCNGYALAMADIIKRLGMSCYVVASSDHAWNLVYVDGNWYHIDATWGKPIMYTADDYNAEGYVKHDYFMISDEEIKALDISSHGSWGVQNSDTPVPAAGNSGAYAGYIFRDAALNCSANYYNGEWYYLTGDYWGGIVTKSRIDGSNSVALDSLGYCSYAQVEDGYLYYTTADGLYTDGIYAVKLGEALQPESIMTIMANKGYRNFEIDEFAVYDNIVAAVLINYETAEWARLEYLTGRRETNPMPVLKIAKVPNQKNYPWWNNYVSLEGVELVLQYNDGSRFPVTIYWNYTTATVGEDGICDAKVTWKGLTADFQVTNNEQWSIYDIFSHESNWVYNGAKYVYDRGYMKGTSAEYFEPDKTMERCMLAQTLYNMNGTPQVTYQQDFSDVPDGQWYTNAVTWAYENGIVAGYGDKGIFGTYDHITREQLAQMLMNYAKWKGFNTDGRAELSNYVDSGSVSDWAANAISWAVYSGVMSGKGNRLDPQGKAIRAEAAAMIKNFCEKVEMSGQ